MAERPLTPRLADIVEAIELINSEMAGVTLAAFETYKRKRWLVERGTRSFLRRAATFGMS